MNVLIEAANTAIGVRDGVVVAPDGEFDRIIRLPEGELRPGLINSHDHLHRNHYGRLGRPPYANAYEWAKDVSAHDSARIARGRSLPRRQALLRGAWKNLMSGVTHVVHHDPWEPDFDQDFPLYVVRLDCADSLGMTPDFIPPRPGQPFALHVAEGTDTLAAAELPALAAAGVLSPCFLAVHAVGADEKGAGLLRNRGAALIWCPTSNHFLFGRSAPSFLLAEGMDVLLGSDSCLSGDGLLLDDIHAARGQISDARILDAVGPLAARRLGIAGPRLAMGAPADLVLLRQPLPQAGLEDVLLVIAKGRLSVLAPDLLAQLRPRGGQMISLRGVTRWIGDTLAGQDGGKVSDLCSG